MKATLFLVLISTLILGCGYEDRLIKTNWIVEEAYYNGEAIAFKSKDLLRFGDATGKITNSLFFFEDGKIFLPGINSSNIRAKWEIDDSKVLFTLDSAHYSFIYDKDLI